MKERCREDGKGGKKWGVRGPGGGRRGERTK